MSLVTRCPNCAASFKVVADQLRIRNGLVRCGACHTVFDGRACLLSPSSGEAAAPTVPAPAPPVLPVAPEPLAPSRVPPATPPVVLPVAPSPTVAPAPREEASPEAARPRPAGPAVLRGRQHMQTPAVVEAAVVPDGRDTESDETYLSAEPDAAVPALPSPRISAEPQVWRLGGAREPRLNQAPEPAIDSDESDNFSAGLAVPGEIRTRFSSATDSGRTPPAFMDDDQLRARGGRRRLWAAGCVLALLALALQLVYVYRDVLASSMPPLRPVLELACGQLGCEVGYPRRLERISIVSSSLLTQPGANAQSADGGRRMMLHLALRNRYDKPQPWPALVLELTDISDTVVARRVLLPQDYLVPAQVGKPFAAGEQVTLAVPVDIQGIAVNGYQLDKFFP